MFPCTISVLDIHHELDWNPIVNRITDYPLSIKEDGSVMYYKYDEEKKISRYLCWGIFSLVPL